MWPLTFPTLMRAFVLHQDDSFGEVLDKVDPVGRRGDILGLLSGARLPAVYALEVVKGRATSHANKLEQSYQAVAAFLAGEGVSSLVVAQDKVRLAELELNVAVEARQLEQARLREGNANNGAEHPISGYTDSIRQMLLGLQDRRSEAEREVIGYQQEAARLRQLLASLEADSTKARRLQVSGVVLSSFAFDVCPRCTQEVTADMRALERWQRCSLCSRPLIVNSDAVPRTAPASVDIAQQLDEAQGLLVEAEADAAKADGELAALRRQEHELSASLDAETAAYVSPAMDRLLALSQRVSEAEARLADARRLLRRAEVLTSLYDDMIAASEAALKSDAALTSAQRDATIRLDQLETLYLETLRDLEFPDISRVEIDPLTLLPCLDGALYVHRGAALRGLAIVAYHLAVLRLSLSQATFFPRLLVIDSPAVGDLNPESHDRLLRYIAEIAGGAWSDRRPPIPSWQIILTTRRMVTELRPYVRMRIKAAPGEMLLRPRPLQIDA